MIHSFSKKISTYLIRAGLPSEKYEVYAYGAECFLNLLICDILLILYAIITHHLLEIIIWTTSFFFLRRHIGGFHANSHFSCIISSVLLGIFCITLTDAGILKLPSILIVFFLCLCIIYPCAPVLQAKHPLPQRQKKQEHTKGLQILGIEFILSLTFHFIFPFIPSSIASGAFAAAVCCLIGYILRLKSNK